MILQLKIPHTPREGGKLLFPQGHSKILNNRTEWFLLKKLYKASHYKRLGSGETVSKTEQETQVAPAGGPAATAWGSWDQHSWFHVFLIPHTTLWKIIPLSTPKFSRCKTGGLIISLSAILCHYTRRGLFLTPSV